MEWKILVRVHSKSNKAWTRSVSCQVPIASSFSESLKASHKFTCIHLLFNSILWRCFSDPPRDPVKMHVKGFYVSIYFNFAWGIRGSQIDPAQNVNAFNGKWKENKVREKPSRLFLATHFIDCVCVHYQASSIKQQLLFHLLVLCLLNIETLSISCWVNRNLSETMIRCTLGWGSTALNWFNINQ